ncbi:MAG: hypothetical protein AAGB93_13255 [Planctomycetota bacterium]
MSERANDRRADVEERAIDVVFDVDPQSASEGGDALTAELDAMRALREEVREALVDEPSRGEGAAAERASETLRAQRVTRRVLARSTREDLGRRGDVGLVVEFVGARLRESALLRIAAAMLLIQLTLVPLVAWHVLRTPEREVFEMRIEPRPEVVDDAPAEERLDGEPGAGEPAELEDALGGLRLVESFARSRDLLRSAARTAAETTTPHSPLDRTLAALGGLSLDRPVDGRGDAALDVGRGVGEVVAFGAAVADVELRLQRFDDSGAWRGLAEALEALAARVRGADVDPRGVELVRRAFAHAQLLGVATPALPRGETAVEAAEELDAVRWINRLASEIEAGRGAGAAEGAHGAFTAAWIAAVRDL